MKPKSDIFIWLKSWHKEKKNVGLLKLRCANILIIQYTLLWQHLYNLLAFPGFKGRITFKLYNFLQLSACTICSNILLISVIKSGLLLMIIWFCISVLTFINSFWKEVLWCILCIVIWPKINHDINLKPYCPASVHL